MFFRKQQSGQQSPQTSTALLESEFDFMPDIMILEKIDTPSGTAIDIDIETSEDIDLFPLNETPFPDLAPPDEHPPAEQDNPVDTSVDSTDTLALDTPESSPEEELSPVETIETSEIADSPITEDTETPDLENISETDIPISETPETPETDTPDSPVSITDSSSDDVIPPSQEQTDSIDPSETETQVVETETVENEEVAENEVFDELDLILEDVPEETEVISGVFTVGENSWVAIDWLYDGGGYSNGQMGIFLLDDLDLESPDFANLALQHVTSNSELGYIVLNDPTEGAKFASTENGGVYQEIKTFNLRAGGNYGFVLIPNGSFEEALSGLSTGAELSPQIQPLFSLITSNPNDQFSSGLLVDVTGDGNTFIMEDLSSKGYSDLDFNDIIFQVRGITGTAVSMDELFDYEIIDLAKDWRTSEVGQAIIEYVMPYVADMEEIPLLEIEEAPTTAQPLIGVIDTGFAQNNSYLDYDKITWGNDFIDNDSDPTWQAGENVTTGNEHGTHVLGEIRELNQNAPIHAIRAVGSGQWAEALVDFVDKARDSGQPNAVVNLSMDLTRVNAEGSAYNRYELTSQERAAIAYAQEHNILLVVSAGNEGVNEGQMTSTWGAAAQEFDNVLVVGAASPIPSPEGEIITGGTTASTWDKSNFSSNGVGIVAEGGTLENPELSTVGDGLGVMAGTSVATAKVTAAAAQVWATNPELSYRQVMEILQSTATDLQMLGWDQETGAGLLNLAAAVQLAKVMTPETVVNPKAPSFQPPPAPPLGSGPTIPSERPTTAAVIDSSDFGLTRVVQVVSQSLSNSATTVKSVGLAAWQGLIAFGGTVVSAPVAITAIGVASAVAIGLVGKAYYDLKQAEAEAAANTAANTWCQANLQRCHAGEAGNWYLHVTYNNGRTNHINQGSSSDFAFLLGRDGKTYQFFRPASTASPDRGGGLICWTPCSVSASFIPASGSSASKNWAGLSAGHQQAVLESGALTAAITQKIMTSAVKGILEPGALINGLTVLGSGNTAGVVENVNISVYTKACNWQFKSGKWLCILNGTAYFPSNIPAATNPRSIPRWILDPNSINGGVWRIDEPPASPSPSPSTSPTTSPTTPPPVTTPPPSPPPRPRSSLRNIIPRVKSVLNHIFNDKRGHVNPDPKNPNYNTIRERYLNLFERVANNPANRINSQDAVRRGLIKPQGVDAGKEVYAQNLGNRQVWVHVNNGRIESAGVNSPPK